MLSARGSSWAKMRYAHGYLNTYHPTRNPNGIVSFSNAENWLGQEDLTNFINEHSQFDKSLCAYGEGYTGTVRLRTAMAKHVNTHFKPVKEIGPEEITFAAGVTELNEVCAMITCNPGHSESILLGKPIYGAFSRDLTIRTSVTPEYVEVGDTDQFSPDCVALYEAGYNAAEARGVKITALIICNPHNPLGQCYPRETLVGLMRLCASKGIHLISDEIYALSVYNRDDRPSEEFTSVRAIDYTGIIDPNLVHVLYGMSKDFGSGGMRLGCVISQNDEFTKATRALCRFSSPSQYSMDLATKILEDQEYVAKFLEKSKLSLTRARLVTEDLLNKAGIGFHQKGNAGFFIWLDLTPFLPTGETSGDGWAAERLLSQRFTGAGVIMATGEAYHAPSPGRFRLVFCLEEDSVREGIRRISRVLDQ
ncbi:acc synthase [Annulohypoxylon maeteangense]|uniref:acc synthase n=1 Tax=Annulohypoxylon maeteangense TaxID=1927788 RepID=UPI002007CBF3|nr:acc synthase [Annulohypoxylon maeteangense]KAI0880483.1 acc synthase [Annulohypoxylon maeteangense]